MAVERAACAQAVMDGILPVWFTVELQLVFDGKLMFID